MNGAQILLIVGVGIAVSSLARRRGIEPGLVIVVLAAAASFIPGMPRLELESEWILAIVVPPLLYSATRGASFSAFGANLRAIIALGVLLVLLTTGALGVVSSWLLPSLGTTACFVLGAVLAPPDTITTVSHGDELGLPKRVTSILTGESLVNDATALTLFTIAVAAVNGEHTGWRAGALELARTASVGLGIGFGFAAVALWIRKRLGNPTLETALVLLLPFTAFLAAEQAHASGILAVVASAFSVSADSTEPGLSRTLLAAGVLLVAAIVIRLAGVYGLFGRWIRPDRRAGRGGPDARTRPADRGGDRGRRAGCGPRRLVRGPAARPGQGCLGTPADRGHRPRADRGHRPTPGGPAHRSSDRPLTGLLRPAPDRRRQTAPSRAERDRA